MVGHYETACGGCDTINKMDRIFELVRELHESGHDVLFEGLLISADVNRTQALHDDGLPLLVVELDVDLDVCLDSIHERRMAKWKQRGSPGDPPPRVNPKNTKSKHRGTQTSTRRLSGGGVDTTVCTRDEALAAVRRALELH